MPCQLNDQVHQANTLFPRLRAPVRDESHPTRRKEETYVPYRMTVEIPDVHCTRVSAACAHGTN